MNLPKPCDVCEKLPPELTGDCLNAGCYVDQQMTSYFLRRLKLLCRVYDQECGHYPEHEYEGRAFYEFASGEDVPGDWP